MFCSVLDLTALDPQNDSFIHSLARLTRICDEGMTFTEALRRTYEEGLFEDDVWGDLEGVDAAEKVLILGRELGYPLQLSDIHIEPLACRRPLETFLHIQNEFTQEDMCIAARVKAARTKNCTLRYMQRIECSPPAELGVKNGLGSVTACVRLEEVPCDALHAQVKGAAYSFCFHTDRYHQSPLIVQGPLSDPANTASGIVGDIMRIARSIGAKDRGPELLSPENLTSGCIS